MLSAELHITAVNVLFISLVTCCDTVQYHHHNCSLCNCDTDC